MLCNLTLYWWFVGGAFGMRENGAAAESAFVFGRWRFVDGMEVVLWYLATPVLRIWGC